MLHIKQQRKASIYKTIRDSSTTPIFLLSINVLSLTVSLLHVFVFCLTFWFVLVIDLLWFLALCLSLCVCLIRCVDVLQISHPILSHLTSLSRLYFRRLNLPKKSYLLDNISIVNTLGVRCFSIFCFFRHQYLFYKFLPFFTDILFYFLPILFAPVCSQPGTCQTCRPSHLLFRRAITLITIMSVTNLCELCLAYDTSSQIIWKKSRPYLGECVHCDNFVAWSPADHPAAVCAI